MIGAEGIDKTSKVYSLDGADGSGKVFGVVAKLTRYGNE